MNANLFLTRLQESVSEKRGPRRTDSQKLVRLLTENWSVLFPFIQSLNPSKFIEPILVGEALRREIIRLNFTSSTILWCLIGSGKHNFWSVLGQLLKEQK